VDDFQTALPLVWPFDFPMESALPQDMDLTLRLLSQSQNQVVNQSVPTPVNAYWVAQPMAQQQPWM